VPDEIFDVRRDLDSHEAICAERWARIIQNQDRIQEDLKRHRERTEDSLARIDQAIGTLTTITAQRAGAYAVITRVGSAVLILFGGTAGWFLTRFFPPTTH
jgi:hypothetical protein